MTKIVSVINYKGGVGKTTVTTNMAAGLARMGQRVLIIDVDPQTNLTFALISPQSWKNFAEKKLTVKDALENADNPDFDIRKIICAPSMINNRLKDYSEEGCVRLICSHLTLLKTEQDLLVKRGLINSNSSDEEKRNYLDVLSILRNQFAKLRESNFYDVVFIDCPPNFNVITEMSIVASDAVLVPTRPDYLSTLGVRMLSASIERLTKSYNVISEQINYGTTINPVELGIIFTMVKSDANGKPIEAQQEFIDKMTYRRKPVPIFKNFIPDNNSVFGAESLTPVVLRHLEDSTVTNTLEAVKEFNDKIQMIQSSES